MSHTEIIHAFIAEELLQDPEEGELLLDDELLISERIDSLGLMRLIAFIDEELGIKVPYGEILIENFRTARVIGDFLATKMVAPSS